MDKIKTIRYAIIDKNDRLCKVGSSQRPATFSELNNAIRWYSALDKSGEVRLVDVFYREINFKSL